LTFWYANVRFSPLGMPRDIVLTLEPAPEGNTTFTVPTPIHVGIHGRFVGTMAECGK